MKRWLTAIACSVVLASVVAAHAWSEESVAVQPKELMGAWYMGTMMGRDCDLRINSNNTLTVQYGGCFHHDKPIKAQWKLQGNKITFEDKTLNGRLGALKVVRYKDNIVLVPTRKQETRGTHQYSYYCNFWRKNMKHGGKLPREARS